MDKCCIVTHVVKHQYLGVHNQRPVPNTFQNAKAKVECLGPHRDGVVLAGGPALGRLRQEDLEFQARLAT
jgi:hypothetical protein